MTDVVFHALGSLLPVTVSLLSARGLYHLFQLESYQFPGYFRSLRRNPVQAYAPGLLAAAASLPLLAVYGWLLSILLSIAVRIVVLAAFLLLATAAGRMIAQTLKAENPKKPFVVTARVRRLYGISAFILAAISWLFGTIGSVFPASLWPVLLPFLIALCGLIAWGPETAVHSVYFHSARRKLMAQKDLIRIGITGSYGKTSVKHILGTILSEKYSVLITPQSYNTPMGVAKTIRERLLPSHQVFISEMGARHVGDIKVLCKLVRPMIGILTSVGPQHLETMKTVERVAKTKYELIDALPTDGHSFFADDQAICRQLYEKTRIPKTLVSLSVGDANVWSENIAVSSEGSAFDLCFADGDRLRCQTVLLGEHNILNILLAAAAAAKLGLAKTQITRGIRRIEPVKSRMELLRTANSYTIINDGFNANPVGAQAALNVLRQFPERRIIVTPGMVELGAREAELNREFGKAIAQAADFAVIIGRKRVQPILDGLREAGFPEQNIRQVASLHESTAVLKQIARAGDTVLYENDLPDNYQEH